MRVISLVPSSTETLLALGVDVAGCTKYCEQPGIAHFGGTKNPDVDAIVAAAPDLVVMDREENRREDHDALIAAGINVYTSDVTDIETALSVIAELADATGVERRKVRVLERASPAVRPSAFVPIWRRPWMTITSSTYGASVLDHIGIDLIDVGSTSSYPTVTLDEVATHAPDFVLVPSEPYTFGSDHLSELQAALSGSRVVRIDGQDLFWWGSRTPAAISRLATALARPATP